jgi:hypothetical protein
LKKGDREMKKEGTVFDGRKNRRSFLKNGVVAAGAMTVGAGLVGNPRAFGREREDHDDRSPITRGDIAILTFLSALEQVEADLWIQYAELGGPTHQVKTSIGLSPIDLILGKQAISTGLAPGYVTALQTLDTDMPQYIADNTDDEISHHSFLNNYLQAKGGQPIDLSKHFAILPPSKVTGVDPRPRLTNLKKLSVDTTWWTRYRSDKLNPDLGDTNFENAVPDLAKGQHRAIPLDDTDGALNGDGSIPDRLKAIANTAGLHFAFVEQGGSSLYPQLAQRVTNLEVLRVLLSIGPSETMHFQVWHDKAGNITTGDLDGINFPDLNSGVDPNGGSGSIAENADLFQTNLIMPEPTFFLNKRFGPISIIRPTETTNAAKLAVQSFVDDGLFLNDKDQNTGIVAKLMELAEAADDARRDF